MNHVPVAIGLVLCEVVIVDEKTHNFTPVNCFSSRRLVNFPGIAEFNVVAWLADGFGEMQTEIIVQRLDSLDVVFRRQSQLRFDDPLKDRIFIARIPDCPFPVPGQYVISLTVDGDLIAHRKMRVHS